MATYTHGHHETVLRSHRWRTAANSAGYLLPHLRDTDRLLDIGAGPGTITADFADSVAQVTATEVGQRELDLSRSTISERGLGNVDFSVQDAHRLTFEDSSFDVTHAHQVLQHVADPVQALREMARVTRPGGLVAARDADYAGFAWWPRLSELGEWLRLYRAAARANGGEPDAGRRLLSWARAAGLPDVAASSSTWCYATAAERAWWGGMWADRILESNLARQLVDDKLATTVDLRRLNSGWSTWAGSEDGWFSVLHGEILCRVPSHKVRESSWSANGQLLDRGEMSVEQVRLSVAVDGANDPGGVCDEQPLAVRRPRPPVADAGVRVHHDRRLMVCAGAEVDQVEGGEAGLVGGAGHRRQGAVRRQHAVAELVVARRPEHAVLAASPVDEVQGAAVALVALLGEPAGRAGRQYDAAGDPVQPVRPCVIRSSDHGRQQVARAVRAPVLDGQRNSGRPAVQADKGHLLVLLVAGLHPYLAGVRTGHCRAGRGEQAGQLTCRLAVADQPAATAVHPCTRTSRRPTTSSVAGPLLVIGAVVRMIRPVAGWIV